MDLYEELILKSSDNKEFTLEKICAEKSGTLSSIIKDYTDLSEPITLMDVDSKNTERIIEYLREYKDKNPKNIPKPLPSGDLKSILSPFDYNFISNISLEEVIDLVNAANYMQIEDLVHLCSARIASEMLIGTVEEVREKFGIKTDMTEDELKQYEEYPLDDDDDKEEEIKEEEKKEENKEDNKEENIEENKEENKEEKKTDEN